MARSAAWSAIEASLKQQLRRIARGPPLAADPALGVEAVAQMARDAHDFDFLIGDWSVRHRRLKRWLTGDTEWKEFTSPASVWKILNGLGNVDEYRIDLPEGTYTGATLRLFNPTSGQWTIYWMDSRNPKLDPPMVGSFSDGRGLFFGDDTFEGKPIRVRFIWSPLTYATCRWEQAFSQDGGETWETNWTMDFTHEPRCRHSQ